MIFSLDGKVILWDIRSVGGSVVEWEPFQGGLANFAVHDRSGVFAAYVLRGELEYLESKNVLFLAGRRQSEGVWFDNRTFKSTRSPLGPIHP